MAKAHKTASAFLYSSHKADRNAGYWSGTAVGGTAGIGFDLASFK
jgi:hypothetical protein